MLLIAFEVTAICQAEDSFLRTAMTWKLLCQQLDSFSILFCITRKASTLLHLNCIFILGNIKRPRTILFPVATKQHTYKQQRGVSFIFGSTGVT